MVKYAVIRDDDINFFTSPKILDELYREIFVMRIPINLSVIPCVRTNIEIKDNPYSKFDGLKFEPFIQREYHGKDLFFPVYENYELVEFIKNMKENVEIIQHGFSHSPNEFSSTNVNELERKITNGRKILKEAFGVIPDFFSAPYDDYSPISLALLRRYFHGATYGKFTLKNVLSLRYGTKIPFNMIPDYVSAINGGDTFFINDNFLLLGHKGISINPFEDVDRFVYSIKGHLNKQKIVVIMQHCWEYFYIKNQGCVGDTINKEMYNAFIDAIQWLNGQNIKFLTISQLYRKLQFNQLSDS